MPLSWSMPPGTRTSSSKMSVITRCWFSISSTSSSPTTERVVSSSCNLVHRLGLLARFDLALHVGGFVGDLGGRGVDVAAERRSDALARGLVHAVQEVSLHVGGGAVDDVAHAELLCHELHGLRGAAGLVLFLLGADVLALVFGGKVRQADLVRLVVQHFFHEADLGRRRAGCGRIDTSAMAKRSCSSRTRTSGRTYGRRST